MSRIAKAPINVPAGVEVTLKARKSQLKAKTVNLLVLSTMLLKYKLTTTLLQLYLVKA